MKGLTAEDVSDMIKPVYEEEINKLKEDNEKLKKSLGRLICCCQDYGLEEESLIILMAVGEATQILEELKKGEK